MNTEIRGQLVLVPQTLQYPIRAWGTIGTVWGRAEGREQSQTTNPKAQLSLPRLYGSVFTLVHSTSAIPEQAIIKQEPLCCCRLELVPEQDVWLLSTELAQIVFHMFNSSKQSYSTGTGTCDWMVANFWEPNNSSVTQPTYSCHYNPVSSSWFSLSNRRSLSRLAANHSVASCCPWRWYAVRPAHSTKSER